MTDELDERLALAGALRDLNHTFVAHEGEPASMRALADRLLAESAAFRLGARRDRMALMRAAREAAAAAGESSLFAGRAPQSGFEDRAVAGRANPTSIEFTSPEDGGVDGVDDEDIVVSIQLKRAFEGAPGRAHGGIVAAAFDDVTGWVIGRLGEPAFTGEISVRFEAPVPVDTDLTVRTRLAGRERRKLFITAEMSAGEHVVATCKATYITVDPTVFAGAPDPR